MLSKYVDLTSVIQVIGSVFNNPSLLDMEDKYIITDEDFDSPFHQIVFGSIYKLHENGVESINITSVEDFLKVRPKSYGVYTKEKGSDWLIQAADAANLSTFDYYYNRLKKMSLLRAYDKFGIDVKNIYDPDILFDVKKSQQQEEYLDNTSLEEIAIRIDSRINAIKEKYVLNNDNEAFQAGEGIFDLLGRLKEHPEVGVPLYGNLINAITRGARLGKFYLRSAPTGVGKSRTMIADACYIGCNKLYDETKKAWISTGDACPVLYITTEQSLDEIQTMMLAFLANVNEDIILNGALNDEEEQRVYEAAKLLQNSPIYVEELPDFSLQDVENTIIKNLREKNINYVFQDYIHTSMKILEEITRRSGGVKLREDNILFMMSTRLKEICKKYDIFILSSTQLNGDYVDSKTPDQNLLRGAKSIADKIDYGSILLPVNQTDIESLQTILNSRGYDIPNLKLSVYKNRRGKYKSIICWCKANLGCCKVIPMFCTTYNYELLNINELEIIVDESAF